MRLRHGLVAAVLIAGCYGPREAATPPPSSGAAPGGEGGAACAAEAARLGAWMKLLAAEGHLVVALAGDLKLVVLGGALPTQVREGPVIWVTRGLVEFQGKVVAKATPGAALGTLTAELSGVLPQLPGSRVIVALDEGTPWAVVAGVAQAAERGGAGELELVFTAGKSQVTPPEGPAPKPPRGQRMPELFTRCGAADDLMERVGVADDREPLLLEELPRAIEQCGCKVELGALRRWLWALWSRDEPGMPMTSVVLAVAAGGAPLTMAPGTPWSVAHAAVVTAARGGRPVALQ